MTFAEFETLSFDCYGTLIDWETGIRAALQPWATKHGLAMDEVISSFATIESEVQSEEPTALYPEVLAKVMRRIGAAEGIETTDLEAKAFGASVGDWPAFPDSAQALQRLKQRYRLAILSNVDRASFARSNRLLEVEFDLVVTAEDVGSYKPDQRNFLALLDRLAEIGANRSTLLHVAQSLFHDHEPALALGLQTVWIYRQRGKWGATPPPPRELQPTQTFPSLAAFADAVEGT